MLSSLKILSGTVLRLSNHQQHTSCTLQCMPCSPWLYFTYSTTYMPVIEVRLPSHVHDHSQVLEDDALALAAGLSSLATPSLQDISSTLGGISTNLQQLGTNRVGGLIQQVGELQRGLHATRGQLQPVCCSLQGLPGFQVQSLRASLESSQAAQQPCH